MSEVPQGTGPNLHAIFGIDTDQALEAEHVVEIDQNVEVDRASEADLAVELERTVEIDRVVDATSQVVIVIGHWCARGAESARSRSAVPRRTRAFAASTEHPAVLATSS